jgi:hypothetical protein
MLRHTESIVCRFRDGLPRDAGDQHLEQPLRDAELYQAEFVLPSRRRTKQACLRRASDAPGHAPQGDDLYTADQGRSRATSEDATVIDSATAEDTPAPEAAEGVEDETGRDRDNMGGGQVERCTAPSGEVQAAACKVVAALAELDDSDAEPDCKSGSTFDEHGNRYPNKPLRLWRTARDRVTWHKDLRRAELADSLSGGLFCSAVLLDRSQPLTIRLRNMMRMAAATAAVAAVMPDSDRDMADGNDSDATLDKSNGTQAVMGVPPAPTRATGGSGDGHGALKRARVEPLAAAADAHTNGGAMATKPFRGGDPALKVCTCLVLMHDCHAAAMQGCFGLSLRECL